MLRETHQKVQDSVAFLQKAFEHKIPGFKAKAAVVLGSGLADALPGLENLEKLTFAEIPGFKPTAVQGHVSEIRFGHIQGAPVVFLRGRNHAYEGFSPAEVVHNVRTMASLGIPHLLMTNAAGCLVESWPVGSLMIVKDHINLTGLNPLAGHEVEKFCKPRFLDMTNCYDPGLRKIFRNAAASLGVSTLEGVYLGVLGPSYETPAEVRMMGQLGAHAVGMSTVLESLAAHHLGMKVGVISCLTNLGAGLGASQSLSHDEVLQVGKQSAADLAKVLLESLLLLP